MIAKFLTLGLIGVVFVNDVAALEQAADSCPARGPLESCFTKRDVPQEHRKLDLEIDTKASENNQLDEAVANELELQEHIRRLEEKMNKFIQEEMKDALADLPGLQAGASQSTTHIAEELAFQEHMSRLEQKMSELGQKMRDALAEPPRPEAGASQSTTHFVKKDVPEEFRKTDFPVDPEAPENNNELTEGQLERAQETMNEMQDLLNSLEQRFNEQFQRLHEDNQ